MTSEQIQQWAREAGFDVYPTLEEVDGGFEQLQAFATLVRNAALEEAAKAREKECDNWDEERPIRICAKEIRSMKS